MSIKEESNFDPEAYQRIIDRWSRKRLDRLAVLYQIPIQPDQEHGGQRTMMSSRNCTFVNNESNYNVPVLISGWEDSNKLILSTANVTLAGITVDDQENEEEKIITFPRNESPGMKVQSVLFNRKDLICQIQFDGDSVGDEIVKMEDDGTYTHISGIKCPKDEPTRADWKLVENIAIAEVLDSYLFFVPDHMTPEIGAALPSDFIRNEYQTQFLPQILLRDAQERSFPNLAALGNFFKETSFDLLDPVQFKKLAAALINKDYFHIYTINATHGTGPLYFIHPARDRTRIFSVMRHRQLPLYQLHSYDEAEPIVDSFDIEDVKITLYGPNNNRILIRRSDSMGNVNFEFINWG